MIPRAHLQDSDERIAGRQRAAAIFMALVIGLVVIMAVHGMLEVWRGYDIEEDPVTAVMQILLLVAAALLYGGAGVVALTMLGGRGVRSVTIYTILQCLRTKVTAVFIVLIVVAIVLVYQVEGDGTLGGRIRTFLSYSTATLGILLAVMTLFVSIGLITGDVKDRQVFTTATKPLARWEYIVGRWLGIVVVNSVILLLAGLAIYALSQHLRSFAPKMPFPDRRTVETEVFVARQRVPANPLPIESATALRIAKEKEDGRYEQRLQRNMESFGGDRRRAESIAQRRISDEVAGKLQTVGPRKSFDYTFSGIDIQAATITTTGTVIRVYEDPEKKRDPVVRVGMEPRYTSHLQIGGPIDVDRTTGTVVWGGRNFADVLVTDDQLEQLTAAGLVAGKSVALRLVPVIQFTYTLRRAASNEKAGESALRGEWEIFNPDPDTPLAMKLGNRQLALYTAQTRTVPAALVGDNGQIVARFSNHSPVSIEVSHADLGVLCPVGSFEGNFFRGLVLMFCWVLFWAAVGLMMGSFMQYAVAFAATALLFVAACVVDFTLDATSRPTGFVMTICYWIIRGLDQLLPGLPDHLPSGFLIDGMMMPWLQFGRTVVMTLAFRTLLILIVACAIFRHRELARVQV